MHSASVAEWIVGRFTGKNRARSIVGDMVELKPQKGQLWFWLSIARIVLSLTWRRPIAFVAAVWAGLWGYGVLELAISGIYTQHRPPEYPWMPVFIVLSKSGAVLWIVLTYLVIRYGLRDKFTQVAFAWAAIITTVVTYWWQPIVLAICIALSTFVILASLVSTQRRNTSLSLLLSVAAGYGVWGLTMYAAFHYQRHVISGPMGGQQLRAHPSVAWIAFCGYLLTVWITALLCSRTHRWLIQSKPLHSGI